MSSQTFSRSVEKVVRSGQQFVNTRLKVASFGLSREEMKNIYILFIRSILEQSATVWHSSLTLQNKKDLETVQKIGCKADFRQRI